MEPWNIMLAPIGAGSCSLAKGALEGHISAYRHWFMFLGQGCLRVFLAKGALKDHVGAYRRWFMFLGQGIHGSSC